MFIPLTNWETSYMYFQFYVYYIVLGDILENVIVLVENINNSTLTISFKDQYCEYSQYRNKDAFSLNKPIKSEINKNLLYKFLLI